jgi:hypothetical protein
MRERLARPAAVPFTQRDRPQALRQRWRRASLAAGWRFPDDWDAAEVDALCAALVRGDEDGTVDVAVTALGMARARSGVGLAETLDDLAALHAVLTPAGAHTADHMPERLLRAAALGWAEQCCDHVATAGVVDELTGLATAGYLRVRLGEVYRGGAADRHALVLVWLDLSRCGAWSRLMPMVLAAQAMRAVFNGAETLALVRPGVAAVLCRRDPRLQRSAARLRRLVDQLLARDPAAACAGPARVSVRWLPASERAACDLVAGVGGRHQ